MLAIIGYGPPSLPAREDLHRGEHLVFPWNWLGLSPRALQENAGCPRKSPHHSGFSRCFGIPLKPGCFFRACLGKEQTRSGSKDEPNRISMAPNSGCSFMACCPSTSVFVGSRVQPLTPQPVVSKQPININTANSEEPQLVPGIGPVTAGKILQMCKLYGAFKSVDYLLAIRGLGPKRLDKMRKYLTVGKVWGETLAASGAACNETLCFYRPTTGQP
jgi:competence ComEA-like helix-hairpin-helix protein